MLDDLLPVAREWQPDLVVHEKGELAAPLVATLVGVPHVTHAFGGAMPAAILADGASTSRPCGPAGSPMPPYAGCYQHLYLDICPPSLQTVPLDHIAHPPAAAAGDRTPGRRPGRGRGR